MADPVRVRPDPKSLLDTANRASEKVAVLHLGFMAVCAYLLVIVFGTTHLDLLLGKGIKLPVVGVDVPIAGFYAVAPFILVLVHFNFLLQLQLLSRKLNAFDFVAPRDDSIGSLRDQLYGFPFTHYLVGRTNSIIRTFLGLMVSITIILLPLMTLIAMQLTFLAYQDESITWAQRVGIWTDIGLMISLWPLIVDPHDDWLAFWFRISKSYSPKWSLWLALMVLFSGLLLLFFCTSLMTFLIGAGLFVCSPLPTMINFKRDRRQKVLLALVLLLISLLLISLLRVRMLIGDESLFQFAMDSSPNWENWNISDAGINCVICSIVFLMITVALFRKINQQSILALVMAMCIFPLLSLSIRVDGEWMELMTGGIQGHQQTQLCQMLNGFRRLSLPSQVLISKESAKPEVLRLIREGHWEKALFQIEPLKLGENRKLRHAYLTSAIILGAQLQDIELQGANLANAQLQGANLSHAQLQRADLSAAKLQGASLGDAELHGANLEWAQLQGADLSAAKLQGANLLVAKLHGANLEWAQLQGASLEGAQLQGANLTHAQLQGASLEGAQLQGANLANAQLQYADLDEANLLGAVLRNTKLFGVSGKPKGAFVDVRGISMDPMSEKDVEMLAREITWDLPSRVLDDRRRQEIINGIIINRFSYYPVPESIIHLDSCLSAANPIKGLECGQRFNASEDEKMKAFITNLHPMLTELACQSVEIAQGLLKQVNSDSRLGLEAQFMKKISDESCLGLLGLSPDKKKMIWDAAKQGK